MAQRRKPFVSKPSLTSYGESLLQNTSPIFSRVERINQYIQCYADGIDIVSGAASVKILDWEKRANHVSQHRKTFRILECEVSVDSYNFEIIKNFVYFGSGSKISLGIKRRINLVGTCFILYVR